MSGLLVSVRSPEEAIAAINGGCDVLDIKEPNAGPLGMASLETISEIIKTASLEGFSGRLSLAAGELEDWPHDRQHLDHFQDVDWVKVGPRGARSFQEWTDQLLLFRQRLSSDCQLIAVLYADTLLEGLEIAEIVPHLKAIGCAGLLIDTCRKQGSGLYDLMPHSQLASLAEACKQAGLTFSIAGKLNRGQIIDLKEQGILPDYFAVRSAVCEAGDRTRSVSRQLVSELKEVIDQARAIVSGRVESL